jgi:CubicO group peptidase (beta-lactamase class C family)
VKTQPYTTAAEARLPRGFDAQGEPAAPGSLYFPAYYGAGGLVSTPNDMMTWLQFNMGIIQQPQLDDVLSVTQSPQAAGVSGLSASTVPGLGWFVSDLESNSGSKLTVLQKDGGLGPAERLCDFRGRSFCACQRGQGNGHSGVSGHHYRVRPDVYARWPGSAPG